MQDIAGRYKLEKGELTSAVKLLSKNDLGLHIYPDSTVPDYNVAYSIVWWGCRPPHHCGLDRGYGRYDSESRILSLSGQYFDSIVEACPKDPGWKEFYQFKDSMGTLQFVENPNPPDIGWTIARAHIMGSWKLKVIDRQRLEIISPIKAKFFDNARYNQIYIADPDRGAYFVYKPYHRRWEKFCRDFRLLLWKIEYRLWVKPKLKIQDLIDK